MSPTVLEARVRQLQADRVSAVAVKRLDTTRLPEAGGAQLPRKAQTAAEGPGLELSGRWAQKLDKEKHVMQKRKQQLEAKLQQRAERRARKQQLRVEPQLQSGRLAARLQRREHRGPWEEQLAWLLQEAPRRLSLEGPASPADAAARARREGQQQRLLAFLECCVLAGQLPLAHHVLVTQHGRSRQRGALTLPMYNAVLLGWARQVRGLRRDAGGRRAACADWPAPRRGCGAEALGQCPDRSQAPAAWSLVAS